MEMRNYHLKITALITAWCLFVPAPAFFLREEPKVIEPPQKIEQTKQQEYFLVMDKDGGIVQYSESDYIMGVVAAEMPASYDIEALKAQTVAAYTVAVRRRDEARKKGEKADIVADSTVDQAFYPIDKTAEKWGSDAKMYKEKIQKVVDSVLGEVLVYENAPIDAVFFAISNGKTEDAKNVWGNDVPYLKSVDSAGDLTANGYLTTVSVSADDFRSVCEENDIKLPEQKTEWIGEYTLSKAGQVLKIQIGDKQLSGKEVRQMFSLRSATFATAFNEDTFTFTVRGYGHGVGMSQFGANYMAQTGATYREILAWYYSGCEIKKFVEL